jgi:spermidine synthase
MIGFGGGRVPMILHHYFPHLTVESTEIDPEVIKVAASHFGISYDHRQKTAIEDGREYLNQRPASTRYDFILNDAFRGTGYGPVHLSTVEFYRKCKEHLAEGGVVAVNLVESDPIFLQKVNTLRECFKSAYLLVDEDATVIFGTDCEPLTPLERLSRAQAIQDRHRFTFDFMRKARALRDLSDCGDLLARLGSTSEVLTDRSIAPLVAKLLKPDDPIFFNLGRNDLCPCGSGKKFKRCHGR